MPACLFSKNTKCCKQYALKPIRGEARPPAQVEKVGMAPQDRVRCRATAVFRPVIRECSTLESGTGLRHHVMADCRDEGDRHGSGGARSNAPEGRRMIPDEEGLFPFDLALDPAKRYFLFIGEARHDPLNPFMREALERRTGQGMDYVAVIPDVSGCRMPRNTLVINPKAGNLLSRTGLVIKSPMTAREFAAAGFGLGDRPRSGPPPDPRSGPGLRPRGRVRPRTDPSPHPRRAPYRSGWRGGVHVEQPTVSVAHAQGSGPPDRAPLLPVDRGGLRGLGRAFAAMAAGRVRHEGVRRGRCRLFRCPKSLGYGPEALGDEIPGVFSTVMFPTIMRPRFLA